MPVLLEINDEREEGHRCGDIDSDVADSEVIIPTGIEVGEWPAVKENHWDGDHLEDGLKFAEDVRGNDGSFGRSDQPEGIDDEVSTDHDDDAEERDCCVPAVEMRKRKINKSQIDKKLISDRIKELAHVSDEIVFSSDLAIEKISQRSNDEKEK